VGAGSLTVEWHDNGMKFGVTEWPSMAVGGTYRRFSTFLTPSNLEPGVPYRGCQRGPSIRIRVRPWAPARMNLRPSMRQYTKPLLRDYEVPRQQILLHQEWPADQRDVPSIEYEHRRQLGVGD
jgi:hypothetical protein